MTMDDFSPYGSNLPLYLILVVALPACPPFMQP
jgi:hypothetical protein